MTSQSPPTVRTGEALTLAGVDPHLWQIDANRGFFLEAPQGSQGRPRRFQLDDVIVVKLYGELTRIGIARSSAAAISNQVRALMRKHADLRAAYVVRLETKTGPHPHVVVEPPEGEPVLMVLSVARYRAALEAPFAGLAS